ncbi:hypothetical protein BGX27_004722 [Mortierella sp. AM989]|nr:hypothetical protein BGX27_004722 [Mortierella sp. AM989]
MTAASKLITIAFTLALVASVTATPADEGARVDVFIKEDSVDFNSYESPPIWEADAIPINHRIDGARGGHDHRRRSESKRAVTDFDESTWNAADFGDLRQPEASESSNVLKKRYLEEDESEEFEYNDMNFYTGINDILESDGMGEEYIEQEDDEDEAYSGDIKELIGVAEDLSEEDLDDSDYQEWVKGLPIGDDDEQEDIDESNSSEEEIFSASWRN